MDRAAITECVGFSAWHVSLYDGFAVEKAFQRIGVFEIHHEISALFVVFLKLSERAMRMTN